MKTEIINKELYSFNKLIELNIKPDKYPADAIISGLIGTYSEDRETVCILINDNLTESEKEDFEKMLITKDQLKEIALTVKTLVTDFGAFVHSYTLKSDPILSKLKIKRITNF